MRGVDYLRTDNPKINALTCQHDNSKKKMTGVNRQLLKLTNVINYAMLAD